MVQAQPFASVWMSVGTLIIPSTGTTAVQEEEDGDRHAMRIQHAILLQNNDLIIIPLAAFMCYPMTPT